VFCGDDNLRGEHDYVDPDKDQKNDEEGITGSQLNTFGICIGEQQKMISFCHLDHLMEGLESTPLVRVMCFCLEIPDSQEYIYHHVELKLENWTEV
jgi:hypothetical protein